MNSLLGAIDCWLVIEWWLLEQEAHQEMRIANVTFYDDTANVLQNTKKEARPSPVATGRPPM